MGGGGVAAGGGVGERRRLPGRRRRGVRPPRLGRRPAGLRGFLGAGQPETESRSGAGAGKFANARGRPRRLRPGDVARGPPRGDMLAVCNAPGHGAKARPAGHDPGSQRPTPQPGRPEPRLLVCAPRAPWPDPSPGLTCPYLVPLPAPRGEFSPVSDLDELPELQGGGWTSGVTFCHPVAPPRLVAKASLPPAACPRLRAPTRSLRSLPPAPRLLLLRSLHT